MASSRSLKVTLTYDGTDFCGWQLQPNGRSVQEVLENAWQSITSESIRITASGRTDAGVHALSQVVSLRTESRLDNPTLIKAWNANLPADVRILDAIDVSKDFHAIRDARRKHYRYLLQDSPLTNVFQRRYVWHLPKRLDCSAMCSAAVALVGEHDFAAFQSSGSPRKTTKRHVFWLKVKRTESTSLTGPLLSIDVEANGFLYNMVRNIVGTLVEVGRGRQSIDWPKSVLASRDRRQAGPTAPAIGLYLVNVAYDPK